MRKTWSEIPDENTVGLLERRMRTRRKRDTLSRARASFVSKSFAPCSASSGIFVYLAINRSRVCSVILMRKRERERERERERNRFPARILRSVVIDWRCRERSLLVPAYRCNYKISFHYSVHVISRVMVASQICINCQSDHFYCAL